jgi:hypothetical protein
MNYVIFLSLILDPRLSDSMLFSGHPAAPAHRFKK